MPFNVFIFQPKNTLKTILFLSNNLTSGKDTKIELNYSIEILLKYKIKMCFCDNLYNLCTTSVTTLNN